jgi:murein DD-endopeptidase MepM/ murein hydrolase activator NlpD
MIYRLSIVEQLTDYNDKIMKELKELVRQNQIKQKELEAKKVELNKLVEEMREQSRKIKGNISSMEGTVPNIKGQLSYYQERVSYYKSVGCKSSDTIGIDCDRPKRVSGGGGSGRGGGRYLVGANGFASPLDSYNYISTGFYLNGYSGHKGIDYAEGCGTPVRAVATGRVYYV